MFENSAKATSNKMSDDKKQLNKEELPYSVWEFNYKPGRYIHKSWLHALPNGELLGKLMGEGRDTERLSNYLMSQLGFDGKFFFDFSNISSQLALWSAADLKKLVMYAGLVCHYKDIQQLIVREQVLEVKNFLGEGMYAFATQRATTFMDFQPDIIKYADTVHLNNRVIISGLVCLHSYMRRFPAAFMKRIIIKLPREWFEHMIKYTPQVSKDDSKKRACLQVMEKTMAEVERDNSLSQKVDKGDKA
ncbi:MAG TPA: hypothetical protein EYG68_01490 [Leucothrix mucor]|nr:hypothetical protein [Leucothrix mucor]